MSTTLAKPAGLPVFPPHADPDGDCMLARLLGDESWRGSLDWPEGFAGGIAHRLDVSTSGALWVADSPEELVALRDLFARGQLHKTYIMRAARQVPWSTNTCDRPIAHDRRRKRRMIVQRGPRTPHRGRWYPARTRFRRLRADLWEVVITTGVTHQIRVHAAFVGLPLLGDRIYGGGSTPSDAPSGLSFYLHHRGLEAPDGRGTDPIPDPVWAR